MRTSHAAALAMALVPGLCVAGAASAQTTYVDDPLTATQQGSAAGVVAGVRGGSFSASGWTTGGDEDTLWYEIPATLPSGRFEVTVRGLALPGNLDGEEHDILTLYGATDHGEPVSYSPAYRNNDFKVLVRIFGSGQSYRTPGASKLELALCPAGEPGYHDPCPAACVGQGYDFWQAYLHGADTDPGWSGSTSYRIVIAWQPGSMSYTRSDIGTWSLSYPGSYAPSALRVRLGSARHASGSGNRMPAGVTFGDVLVVGEPGAATPACEAQGVDAGAAVDAGCGAQPIQSLGVTPAAASGTAQLFETGFRHCLGVGAFRVVQLWVGDAVQAGLPALNLGYDNVVGLFYGEGAQTCAPGAAATLGTAYGSLDCAGSWVAGSGTDGTVGWALQFNPSTFAGTHGLFVDAKGPESQVPEPRLGWTQVGSYTVVGAADAGSGDAAQALDVALLQDSAPPAADAAATADATAQDRTALDSGARDAVAADVPTAEAGLRDRSGQDRDLVATARCGCASGPASGSLCAALGGVALLRRRRRGPRPG